MLANYNGIQVPFYDLGEGGVDLKIKNNMPPVSAEESSILLKYFQPNDIVYDVGAYIGSHAIFFALNGAKVYAFEPSFKNYNKAVKNCAPFRQIELFNVALHNKTYSCHTRFKDCATPNSVDEEQAIQYVVLEDFIHSLKLPYPNFIKLDVEGMESLVLNTFKNIFLVVRPVVYVELHVKPRLSTEQDYENNPHWRYPDQGGFDFSILNEYDYVILSSNGEKLPKDWYPKEGQCDFVILVPNERL